MPIDKLSSQSNNKKSYEQSKSSDVFSQFRVTPLNVPINFELLVDDSWSGQIPASLKLAKASTHTRRCVACVRQQSLVVATI